jgi:hypothetical protein
MEMYSGIINWRNFVLCEINLAYVMQIKLFEKETRNFRSTIELILHYHKSLREYAESSTPFPKAVWLLSYYNETFNLVERHIRKTISEKAKSKQYWVIFDINLDVFIKFN